MKSERSLCRPKTALPLQAFHALFPDEAAARAWFEKARWPDGPVCPKCASVDASLWMANVRRWKCRPCTTQFSVMVGTPMHRSHLPLLVWAQALYLMVSSSKGISSMKLAERLGINYTSAWHLSHRIRAMMEADHPLLAGVVELDETYAGAAPRAQAQREDNSGNGDDPPFPPPFGGTRRKAGRGTKRPMVLAAVERGGPVVAKPLATHSRTAIGEALKGLIARGTTVMTDGLPAYRHLSADHDHLHVIHSRKAFARTDPATGRRVHVNTAESWFATLHRALVGVFHSVAPKHLGRYAAEAAFRWNLRAQPVLDRMAAIVACAGGRRLTFAALTAKAPA